ncbi:MAG: phosphatase PAP2 family protein [Flavobacteriia bacterium]|nr:phosphatase PAP2 family protein [Flavobacteriia bacterium]
MRKSFLSYLFFGVLTTAFGQKNFQQTKAYIDDVKQLTDVMIYDVTSPVAAARYYAYSTLASYELMATQTGVPYPSFTALSKLRLTGIPAEVPSLQHPEMAYRYVLLYVGSKLLPSGKKLLPRAEKLKQALPPTEAEFVEAIGEAVLTYASQDGFLQLNNLKRYTPKRGPAYWQPTKPTYMAPIEPHWNTLKTFFLDRPDQFLTQVPATFDLDSASPFYAMTLEVKNVVDENHKEKNEIAAFWDCNPYAISQIGHLEFGLKKISPGGHWMGIAGIACKKARFSLQKTIYTHTLLALTLHDSFVACWDEKYRSDRIRPETVINRYIDKTWTPLLQTPPFPEYVSGHSVVSTSSALILTQIFGDNFRFKDTTENEFGLKPRTFKSFNQAAEEASISRIYGGIHFMDAVTEGQWLGRQVGQFVLQAIDPGSPSSFPTR